MIYCRSAHIIYAFVTSHGDSKERVIGALEALGWPIFQVRIHQNRIADDSDHAFMSLE